MYNTTYISCIVKIGILLVFLSLSSKLNLYKYSTSKWLYKDISLSITSYQPEVRQTDTYPFLTANSTNIRNWKSVRYCAISRDLFKYYKYGDYIRYKNHKYKIVDKMNKRFKRTIDLCVSKRIKDKIVKRIYIRSNI